MQISKKWSVNSVVLCVVAILLAGCGGGGGGGSTPAAPTTGSVKFTNSSTLFAIDEAYLALPADPTWGVKRNSSAIATGTSWTLSGVAPNTYDSAITSYGSVSNYYAYSYGFAVTAGSTYTLTASNTSYTGTLVVNNTSGINSITALYVSTSGYGMGGNVLSSSIAPGTSRNIVNIPSGTYFVSAVHGGVTRNNSASIASHSWTGLTYN
jgi:hypothetical protein